VAHPLDLLLGAQPLHRRSLHGDHNLQGSPPRRRTATPPRSPPSAAPSSPSAATLRRLRTRQPRCRRPASTQMAGSREVPRPKGMGATSRRAPEARRGPAGRLATRRGRGRREVDDGAA
jgi:hypothetical protein